MIKVFIPQSKGKIKTLARGFWYSKETKKTYYDYVKVVNWKNSIADLSGLNSFRDYLDTIKSGYNQESIFFVNGNIGNCYYSKNKIEILPHRIYKEILKGNLKKDIKKTLKDYNGITIYNQAGRYYSEVFTTI